MKLDSLQKLFAHELKDLYSAETQLTDALPKMAEAASDPNLKDAFKHHLKETRGHITRLDKVFQALEFSPGGERCAGMAGLIEEGEDAIKDIDEPHVRDAALIAAAQRVEHYEMAGYGTARTFAEKLGNYEAADLLQETLNEESAADLKLTRLAERYINFEALRT